MKIKRVNGGAVAGSVIIAIVMTAVLAVTTILVLANQIFTAKFISATISNIRIEEIEIPIEIDGKEYDTVGEAVTVLVTSGNLSEEEVAEKQEVISDFMAESGFNDLIANVMAEGMDAIMSGEEKSLLTNEDIMNFVEENEALIEETFEVEITEEMKSEIEQKVEEAEVEKVFTTKIITETIYETEDNPIAIALKSIKAFFSIKTIIIGYVIALLMWVGIFFLNKAQFWFAGFYLAIPAMLIGVGTMVGGLSVDLVAGAVMKEVSGMVNADIFSALTDLMFTIGAVYFIAGIVLLILSIVLRAIARKNTEQEAFMS